MPKAKQKTLRAKKPAKKPLPGRGSRKRADKNPIAQGQKKNPSKKRIDWLKLQREYLSNPTTTLSDLAQKYMANPSEIGEHASAGHWKETRDRIFAELADRLPGDVTKDLKREQEHATSVITSVGHRLIKLIDKNARVAEALGLMRSDELRNLAGAYKAAAETLRLSLGMATVITEPPEALKIEKIEKKPPD